MRRGLGDACDGLPVEARGHVAAQQVAVQLQRLRTQARPFADPGRREVHQGDTPGLGVNPGAVEQPVRSPVACLQERGYEFWVMRDPWGNEF